MSGLIFTSYKYSNRANHQPHHELHLAPPYPASPAYPDKKTANSLKTNPSFVNSLLLEAGDYRGQSLLAAIMDMDIAFIFVTTSLDYTKVLSSRYGGRAAAS